MVLRSGKSLEFKDACQFPEVKAYRAPVCTHVSVAILAHDADRGPLSASCENRAAVHRPLSDGKRSVNKVLTFP